jgi:hypothetical protein
MMTKTDGWPELLTVAEVARMLRVSRPSRTGDQ